MKSVEKYLDRWAASQTQSLSWGHEKLGHVLVVPAHAEDPDFLKRVQVPTGPLGSVLTLVVLNGRESDPAAIHELHQATRKKFPTELGAPLESFSFGDLYQQANGFLLLVDCARPGQYFPKEFGVGLARKIGFDLALSMWHRGHVRSPWIHTTDADATLPVDYFHRAQDAFGKKVSALVYPFQHQSPDDPDLAQATVQYETYLNYYVEGLRHARSPYAFHSVGSTLAVEARSYAAVRGFPRKRLAGEDFYVLNKLAKVGQVVSLKGCPIVLAGRTSSRVPFGTGATLTRLTQGSTADELLFYDPRIFECLGAWQETLCRFASNPSKDLAALLKESCQERGVDEAALSLASKSMGALVALESLAAITGDEAARLKRFQTWFDGFRTMKWIHALRNHCYPSVPMEEALARAPFWREAKTIRLRGDRAVTLKATTSSV